MAVCGARQVRLGPRMREVRDYVIANPGVTRADVARALGLPQSTASRAVASCIKYGCVQEYLPGSRPTVLMYAGLDGATIGAVLRPIRWAREDAQS